MIYRTQDIGKDESGVVMYTLITGSGILGVNLSYSQMVKKIKRLKPKDDDIIERYAASGEKYGESKYGDWKKSHERF